MSFVKEQSIVRFNKQIEPTILPTAPEPRFWPTFVVSAAEISEKKSRSSKHTTQPNARQTRVYGKEKKKSDDAVEEKHESKNLEQRFDNKLSCKYR